MFEDASHILGRHAWLVAKSAWQNLARIRTPGLEKLTVFVTGVQRSGTNMVMDAYERSLQTEVFHESDSRLFIECQQRDQALIQRMVRRSPAQVVVIKALLEAHRVRQLLDDFAPARALWIYRHFDDTVNSIVARWPRGRNLIDQIVADRSSGEWRALGMSDETYAVVRRHYSRSMNNASAHGLLYYYRHQLFYDQCLDTDPRVLLMSYEDLTSAPATNIEAIATFSNLACTPRMRRHVHNFSVRRSAPPDIAPEIRELATKMYERLRATQRKFRMQVCDSIDATTPRQSA